MTIRITQVALADLDLIAPLRRALWPDSAVGDLAAIFARDRDYLLLTALKDGQPIAFAEISARHDYVNGCDTSPVAFLEGIYVDPAHRRGGVARGLVEEASQRMRARGLTEFASDALLDNRASHAFHRAMGFEETGRVVYFHRALKAPA